MAPSPDDDEPAAPRKRGPNWGNIIAYSLMAALGILALAPLLSALK